MTTDRNSYYCVNTRTDWNEPPRARHQLAEALYNKKYPIIFIAKNKFGWPGLELYYHKQNFIIITPSWYIPGGIRYRLPFVNELYQIWLYKKIFRKFTIKLIVNFDHTSTMIYRYHKNVVFFCNDSFTDTIRSKNIIISLYYYITQKYVAKKSAMCFSSSDFLTRCLKKYNSKSYTLLSGSSEYTNYLTANRKYKKSKKTKKEIVYVGWISKRLDLNLILQLCNNNFYKITFIGAHERSVTHALNSFGNVCFLGAMTGIELHKILLNADLFIAPYRVNKDISNVVSMPNKFWLYLSYGRPIVSCVIPNLIRMPDKFVYQSKDKEMFNTMVEKALCEDSEALFNKRKKFARNNSWQNRIRWFLDKVDG